MTADVPTLMLMIVVSSVAMAAALLVLGWGNWRDGLHYWAGSLLVAAVGYVLFMEWVQLHPPPNDASQGEDPPAQITS